MKILFAENHGAFARIVTGEFLADHEVVVVPCLAGARKLLGSSPFHLVILDYDLDDGKGTLLMEPLAGLSPRPRGIAASSRDDGNEMLLAADAGAVCSKLEFGRIGAVISRLLDQAGEPAALA